jgi:hypothetical protein
METEMKRIWGKIILSLSGILALVGINASSGQANIQFNKQIAEVRQTTPLYLNLGGGIQSNHSGQKSAIKLAQHDSHYSHSSHESHSSHYSSSY